MTSVTFTPASMKSKALASLHRHEKRLKSCMCYKKFFMVQVRNFCFKIYHRSMHMKIPKNSLCKKYLLWNEVYLLCRHLIKMPIHRT